MGTGTNIEKIDLSDDQLENAAELLKMLAHPCRLKIILLLCKRSMAVNEIVEETDSVQATISGHLRRMKIYGIVESEHKGREVWYSINNRCAVALLQCVCENQPEE